MAVAGARVGRKRVSGQQEDENSAPPHPAGGEERRGAEQVAWTGDDRERRSAAEHPHGAVAEEDGRDGRKAWEGRVSGVKPRAEARVH
jgi:hypothetical protein